eukprot:Lankesteria_metandrocarpae@DN4536_c0_g1_i2.p3
MENEGTFPNLDVAGPRTKSDRRSSGDISNPDWFSPVNKPASDKSTTAAAQQRSGVRRSAPGAAVSVAPAVQQPQLQSVAKAVEQPQLQSVAKAVEQPQLQSVAKAVEQPQLQSV